MLTFRDHVCAFAYAMGMTTLIALTVPGIVLGVAYFYYTVFRLAS